MTSVAVIDKVLFILELTVLQMVMLMLLSERKDRFFLRAAAGSAGLVLFAMGYYPLYFVLSSHLPSFVLLTVIWYLLMTLMTILFSQLCFKISAADSLYVCLTGYAAQHIVYAVFQKLAVRRLWPGILMRPALYFSLSILCTVFMGIILYALFSSTLTFCDGIVLGDHKESIVPYIIHIGILIAATFGCQYFFENYEQGAFLSVMMSVMICIIVLSLQYAISRLGKQTRERIVIEQMLADAGKQYALTHEMVGHINRICHDLKHNLQALRIIDETQRNAYIAEVESNIDRYHELVHTENPVLNTILASKCLFCDKKKINLSCMVDCDGLDFMSVPDVYALIGNAIDNAVECVDQFEEPGKRVISFTIRQHEKLISIQTNNYCSGIMTFREGLAVTTKSDAVSHGYGLKSIRYLAEKYGGSAGTRQEGNVFILDILLPVPI